VRELVGEDGEAIAEYMLSVMRDEKARTADRLEAAKWLADRAFGRSVQTMDLDITSRPAIDLTKLSMGDLQGACQARFGPNSIESASPTRRPAPPITCKRETKRRPARADRPSAAAAPDLARLSFGRAPAARTPRGRGWRRRILGSFRPKLMATRTR
jgi:hypothetical protein